MKILFVSALLCLCSRNAELKTYNPGYSSELQSAIDVASAGDVISLDVKDYEGDFTLTKSGSNGNPITIIGKSEKNKSTCIVGSNTAFNIRGNHWVIQGLAIKDADYAAKILGNRNNLTGLAINGVKKGVWVKGQYNTISDCAIGSRGTAITFETGDYNQILNTAVSSDNPNVNILEGTCCGIVDSSTFQGPVVLKGNKYQITSNVAKGGVNLEGCENELSSNIFSNVYFTRTCRNNDAGLNMYQGMPSKVQPFDMEKVGESGASENQFSFSVLAIVTNALFFFYSTTVLYL